MSFSFFIFIIIPLLSFSSVQSISSFSISNSPWHPSQNQTLLSPSSAFAAGFRHFPGSSNLYTFSIWYHNISDQTIVWSANRGIPVQATASLIITSNGQLRLTNGSSRPTIWSTPTSVNSNSTGLFLRDDGNLVFGSWQSFDYPTDTFLPNQTLTNTSIVLKSKNGKFSLTGLKNLVFNGSDTYLSLPNRLVSFGLDGRVETDGNPIYSADFGKNRIRMLTLGNDGNLRILTFNPHKGIWILVWEALLEICQVHGLCGTGYICYSDGSTLSGYECVCPPGYMRSPTSDSCVIKTPNLDLERSKFLRLDYVNYSGGSNQTNLMIFSFANCSSMCLENHKCLGFGFKYDGSGYCVLQLDKLLNGYWSPNTEMSFYLRVSNSEPDKSNFTGMSELLNTTCPTLISLPNPSTESNNTTLNIIIVSIIFTFEIASGVLLFWAFLKRYVKYRDMAQTLGLGLLPTTGPKRFTYAEIKSATKDFSEENVIGNGAFSDVYMGKLQDGRPVAVKCLKNVTVAIRSFGPRSNHNGRNDEDNIHEIDSTSSLEQRPMLDWNIRYRIAIGVARAIAYLHEECLEWVLHCDIKPENILLGDDFCPKVADFGLSKLKKKEQLVTMSRVRGTRGYLAPEWRINHNGHGTSVTSKVDVYSFGMVLLEIVTGKRNMIQGPSIDNISSHEWYFPKWAFEMAIEEGKMEDILDRQIKRSYDDKVHFQLIDRMVKTALWCVQEKPEARPSMGKVAKMLEGTVEIMEPPKPTMYYL
uniref:Receptor-like serine/threonine-protein kinase n=1 Tax=Chenopodium quinoa TaxID=63459 RepID=A0A803M1P9_CHEQI